MTQPVEMRCLLVSQLNLLTARSFCCVQENYRNVAVWGLRLRPTTLAIKKKLICYEKNLAQDRGSVESSCEHVNEH
jgi:hypothetical protein